MPQERWHIRCLEWFDNSTIPMNFPKKILLIDREPGVEVHSTDKLLTGKPFPKGNLLTVHNEHPLQKAETLDGREVTAALRAVDGQRVSPAKLLTPRTVMP